MELAVMIAAIVADALMWLVLYQFRGEILDWLKEAWRKARLCFRNIAGG